MHINAEITSCLLLEDSSLRTYFTLSLLPSFVIDQDDTFYDPSCRIHKIRSVHTHRDGQQHSSSSSSSSSSSVKYKCIFSYAVVDGTDDCEMLGKRHWDCLLLFHTWVIQGLNTTPMCHAPHFAPRLSALELGTPCTLCFTPCIIECLNRALSVKWHLSLCIILSPPFHICYH